MSKVSATIPFVAFCFASILLPTIVLSPVATAQERTTPEHPLKWYVELNPQDSKLLSVYIDTKSFPSNKYIKDISFDVTFYDAKHRVIKRKRMMLSDNPFEVLRPGLHSRDISHPYTTARSIEAKNLQFKSVTGGRYALPNMDPPAGFDKELWDKLLKRKVIVQTGHKRSNPREG